jgi:peptide-methionine (S)-S-oxide reductase
MACYRTAPDKLFCAVRLSFYLVSCIWAFMPQALLAQDSKQPLSMTPSPNQPSTPETATLAGGCFWCVEALYQELKGVSKVTSGYTGGTLEKPSYEQVVAGTSGHAEAVQVEYDPQQISFHDLLIVFFHSHDPTTKNRQGADVGTQYRSAIFFSSAQQKQIAEQTIKEIETAKLWSQPIVTELSPLGKFYAAEDYHQDFFARNKGHPYCSIVIGPKIAKLRKEFAHQLKSN